MLTYFTYLLYLLIYLLNFLILLTYLLTCFMRDVRDSETPVDVALITSETSVNVALGDAVDNSTPTSVGEIEQF